MSWKKMVFGEKMPDKDDPKYKERYKKEVAAGVLFCFRPVVPANEGTGTKDPLCGSSINSP